LKNKLGFILISLLFLAACEEDPAPTGVQLLPDNDLIDVVAYNSQDAAAEITSSTFLSPSSGEKSSALWLGSVGSYESVALLRWFSFTEAIGDEGVILETKMILRAEGSSFGAPSAQIGFDALEIINEWDVFDLTSEHLGDIQTESVPRGSYQGNDSVMVIDLDTAMVREWMNRFTHNINATSENRIDEPFGIKLQPKGMTAIQALHSINSSIVQPELYFIVQRGDIVDTLLGRDLRDTYVTQGPDYSAQPLSVHGGLSNRGRIKFDLSGIPDGSIVSYVKLTLTRDSTQEMRSNLGLNAVQVFEALSTEKDSTSGSSALCQPTSDTAHVFVAEGTVDGGTLLLAVQRWVASPSFNRGFIITKLAESSDLDQIIFHGASADPDKRPRLEVYYTTKP
jgi:hypothetical protein